jgi:hypothetical protein
VQLVPNSAGATLAEYNHCHNPSCGPNCGGQFCSRGASDAFVPAPRAAAPRAAAARSSIDALVEPYGEHAATLREVHRQIVQLAQDGNEHLALQLPGGEVQYFTSGSEKFVNIDRALADAARANPTILSIHNHPTGSAPSSQDLRSAVSLKSRRELIVGSNGEWYELEITDMEKAQQVVFEGRRRRGYWERQGTKGKFETSFNKLRLAAVRDAAALTDQWAAEQFGWTPSTFLKVPGFMIPGGPNGTRFVDRKEAGKLQPEMRAYHSARFAELSPRIWIKLAERHKDWLKFRYHRSTGPHATTTSSEDRG